MDTAYSVPMLSRSQRQNGRRAPRSLIAAIVITSAMIAAATKYFVTRIVMSKLEASA
jgi:hypothetical protein